MWYICINCHRGYEEESQLVEHKVTQHGISRYNKSAIIFGQMDLLPSIHLNHCAMMAGTKPKTPSSIRTGPLKIKSIQQNPKGNEINKNIKTFNKYSPSDVDVDVDVQDKNYLWEKNIGSSIKICQVSTVQTGIRHNDIQIKNEPTLDSCPPKMCLPHFNTNDFNGIYTNNQNPVVETSPELQQQSTTGFENCVVPNIEQDHHHNNINLSSNKQTEILSTILHYPTNKLHESEPKYTLRPRRMTTKPTMTTNLSGSESEYDDTGIGIDIDSDFSESEPLFQHQSKSQKSSSSFKGNDVPSTSKSESNTTTGLNHNKSTTNMELHSSIHTTKFNSTGSTDIINKTVEVKIKKDKQQRYIRKTYICGICNKPCVSSISLKSHLGNKHGELVYNCSICSKGFKTKTELNQHKLIHDINQPKPYKCKTCDKTFGRPQYLKSHYSTAHTIDKKYECHICQKKFKTKGGMAGHQRYYHGTKKYICDICNKGFGTNSTLKFHKFIHNTRKEYLCSLCGKEYLSPISLKEHEIKFHVKFQSYPCEKCDKKFNSFSELKGHQIKHIMNKSILCSFCGKTYSRAKALKSHILKFHTDGPIGCECCGRRFQKEEIFKQHIQPKQSNKHQRGECWKFYTQKSKDVTIESIKKQRNISRKRKRSPKSDLNENEDGNSKETVIGNTSCKNDESNSED